MFPLGKTSKEVKYGKNHTIMRELKLKLEPDPEPEPGQSDRSGSSSSQISGSGGPGSEALLVISTFKLIFYTY